MSVSRPEDISVLTFSHNQQYITVKDNSRVVKYLKNYAGIYNFYISLFNDASFECTYDNEPKKRQMRGGRFFLTSFIKTVYFVFHIVSCYCWLKEDRIPYLLPISLAISVLYSILTTYNAVIFKKNGEIKAKNFFHNSQLVPSGSRNTFYEIEITNQQQLLQLKSHASNIQLLAAKYSSMKKFDLMFYKDDFYTEITCCTFVSAYFACLVFFLSSLIIMINK